MAAPSGRGGWRALENALPQLQDGKRLRFLFLAAEHDPDSYVREFGREAFEHLIGDESLPLSAYLLRELTARVDLATPEGRSALLEHAKPLLTAIAAPSTALLLRKEVAALAGVAQTELEALYGVKSLGGQLTVRRAPPKAARASPSGSWQRLLCCLLAKPELAQALPESWDLTAEGAEAVSALVASLSEQDFAVTTAALIQQFAATPHEAALTAASIEVLNWGEAFDVTAEFRGVLEKLRDEQRKQQWQELDAKVRQVGLAALSEQERTRYSLLLRRG